MDLDVLTSLLMIIGIDIILGGDNAIVIALASRNLPENKRNLAIILGTSFAIVVRMILTVLAVYLLTIPYLQLVGGFLLLLIAYQLLTNEEDESESIKAGSTLAAAVKTIVIADMVMGLDNVLGVAGAAHGNIVLVFIGLMFSVPIIIWGSKIILHLMERFPILIYVGAGILAFTGGKMILNEEKLQTFYAHYHIDQLLPYLTLIAVITAGFLYKQIKSVQS